MVKKIKTIKKPEAIPQSNAMSSYYNTQTAISYGSIDSNNEDGTTNVLLNNGFITRNINISSTNYPAKEPLVGGVKYPPLNAQVIIIHPVNDINSGFIMPAPLDYRDPNVQSEILGQGDKEISEGGWVKTFDPETGGTVISNSTFNLILDPDGKIVSLVDFEGNTIKNNGTVWEINGTTKVARFGDSAKVILSGIDIQALAVALLTTGGFVPASAPVPASTSVTFTGGEITSGSDKVKVG